MIDLNTKRMIEKQIENNVYVSAVYSDRGVMLLNSRGQRLVN